VKAGRNDPCPCGSGKKHKHCCYQKLVATGKAPSTGPKQSKIKELIDLFAAKRFTELEGIALEMVARHPNSGVVWKLLGATLLSLKKEALPELFKAVELLPNDAEALNNLGVALTTKGRYAEALAQLGKAIEIKPDYADAYGRLGMAYQFMGCYAEALVYYEKALSLDPTIADSHNNLGIVLTTIGRLDEAVIHLRRAIELEPHRANAYKNLGNALQFLGDLDGAAQCGYQALAMWPADVHGRINLGNTLQKLGRHDEAIQCFEIALALDPNNEAAIYNRSFSMLSLGRIPEGWADYDYRPTRNEARHGTLPHWAGEDLSDKSIVLWGEQGIGDELLYASMYAEVIARAASCVIECHPKLLPLLVRTFPGAKVVLKTDPPHTANLDTIHYQCAAGSLARWLRPSLQSFPERASYVTPNSERVQYWQERLAEIGPGPKIGICWRSMKNHGSRMLHYTTLDLWGPIFTLPGVHFVNLQYDKCDEELDAARQLFGVPLHAFPEVDLLNDLDEAAALTQTLDLVISAGTASSVIAAALGVPTWLIEHSKDWGMLGADYMPWLPSQRNFCRHWNQPWSEVIAEIAQLLESALAERH
jgi:tetratricopeptide (TPR) repeat protein